MEIETLTRKWGNSIVVIIPAGIAEQKKIKENERVVVTVEKKIGIKVKDVFGMLKGWKRPTDEIISEARKGWKD